MNQALNIVTWNVKGIKTKEKADRLWQVMRRKKEVTCWCIQEHHLGAMTMCKQTLGELVFFYTFGEDGSSGVCMAINHDLHLKVVFKHPYGHAIGIQVTLKEATLLIVNVYYLNSAKLRGGLWQDLPQEQFTREWILVGDFNMVQSR